MKDHELKFNKTCRSNPDEGKANIIPKKGKMVEGVLYKISEEGLENLDTFEGYPEHNNRIIVIVALDKGDIVNAFADIAQPRYLRKPIKRVLELSS